MRLSAPHRLNKMAETGRFLTGSTMGHVVRMTATGAAGITFVFAVDAANLLWLSQLGDPRVVAAIGFAFAVQFFSVSVGVGMMIAATALVSRQIGEGNADDARHTATGSMILTVLAQALVALLIMAVRYPLLEWAGAEGQTLDMAARYLALTLPSLPLMAVGLIASAALRASGDGKRAMYVTLGSGAVAAGLDPFLILWLEMGLDGAAVGLFVFRIIMATIALRFAIGTHNLLARPSFGAAKLVAWPFVAIALPAMATQIAAPFGNYLLTAIISEFGDAAVAGWAVVNRLSVVAFGGIFALAGAIGGIFGQNFGAQALGRVQSTYRDAILFVLVYCLAIWAVLVLLSPHLARIFGLEGEGADVLRAFTHVGAGAFAFTGTLFVANSAFNSLGRPVAAAVATWARDVVVIFPVALWMASFWGAIGVIYAQAVVGALMGVCVAWAGWRFVSMLDRHDAGTVDLTMRRGYRDPNRYRRR